MILNFLPNALGGILSEMDFLLPLRVSSETETADDEEDDLENSYDDSFIDDRINPTAASTQAESSGVDMVAIYRYLILSLSLTVHTIQ